MPTTECPNCKSTYPSVLKTCPSCGKRVLASDAKIDIKKFIPLMVALDLVIVGIILYVFVFSK